MPHMRGDEPAGVNPLSEKIFICPTCVGMNRINKEGVAMILNMPHMRGDEPYTTV